MAFKTYREESRKQWGSSQKEALNIEQINCGAILRIADATEKMAERITSLINENVRLQKQNEFLTRSNRVLRGMNRKLKSKS